MGIVRNRNWNWNNWNIVALGTGPLDSSLQRVLDTYRRGLEMFQPSCFCYFSHSSNLNPPSCMYRSPQLSKISSA